VLVFGRDLCLFDWTCLTIILTTVIGYCGLMIVNRRTLLLPPRSSPLKTQDKTSLNMTEPEKS